MQGLVPLACCARWQGVGAWQPGEGCQEGATQLWEPAHSRASSRVARGQAGREGGFLVTEDRPLAALPSAGSGTSPGHVPTRAHPQRCPAVSQRLRGAPREFREKQQCPVLQGAALRGEQGQNPLCAPSLLRSPLSQGIFLPSIPFVAFLLLPFPSVGCRWVSCSGSVPCAPAGCAWGAPWRGALPTTPGRTPSCQGAQGGYRRREKLNNPVTGMKVNSRSGEH